MRKYILILLAAMLPMAVFGESKESRAEHKHQLSIGIGEGLLPALSFCVLPYIPDVYYGVSVPNAHQILSEGQYSNDQHIRVPHFFFDYQYRVNHWFSAGVQTDFTGEHAIYHTYTGYGDYLGCSTASLLEWTIMPVILFTYFHREWVNLYSGGGIGFGLCTYIPHGEKADVLCSPAWNITPLGLSIGKNHWFGNLEIGLMMQPAFGHFFERFCTASIGYRF